MCPIVCWQTTFLSSVCQASHLPRPLPEASYVSSYKLSIWLAVNLLGYLSVKLPFCQASYLSESSYVKLCVCWAIYLFGYVSVKLSFCKASHLSSYLFGYLLVKLSTRQASYLSTCLSLSPDRAKLASRQRWSAVPYLSIASYLHFLTS